MDALALSQAATHGLAREAIHDKIIGCIVGSALGDAIGLYTEFLSGSMSAAAYPSRTFTLHPSTDATPFHRDAHRSPHQPGDWTDDTDHAILILLSYLHSDCKAADPLDFAARLSIWVRFGLCALDTLPLGLGMTVGAIVRKSTYLDDAEGTARSHWKGSRYKAAPNGSLMRTHPVGVICLDKSLRETFATAAAFSVVTHVDPRCIISCAVGTALVRGLLRHEVRSEADVDAIITEALSWWKEYREDQQSRDAERRDEPDLDLAEFHRHARVTDGGLAALRLDERDKIGYVYKTLGAGIHLLRMAMRSRSNDSSSPSPSSSSSDGAFATRAALFEALVTELIMLGGDADTNACFAGALLGAYLGYAGLPLHWREGLRSGAWLVHKAEGLCQLLRITDGSYSGSGDKDTAPYAGKPVPTEADMEDKRMRLYADMTRRDQERDGAEGGGEAPAQRKGWRRRR